MTASISETLQRMSQRRVLVIGDVIVDEYVVGESTRVSAEAPVAVLQFTGRRTVLGGAGNTAANVASLGGRVSLIGLVGDDMAGGEFTQACRTADIDFVPLRDGRSTTKKVRVISQQQQLLRIDYEQTADIDGACAQRLLEAFAERLGACDIVVVSDYAKGLLTSDTCREIVRAAHAAGRQVIIDPRPTHASFYWSCDYLTPNWRESLGLLGESDIAMTPEGIRRVATLVSRKMNASVLLTLGAQGIAFVERTGGQAFVVPAEAQEVFDVSGAGDTVVAAFALAKAAGCADFDAVSVANRAAGIVVGKRGTATVTPDEMVQNGRSGARLLAWGDLAGFGERHRRQGQRLVTVAGAFDELRSEDLDLFARARQQGDVLVVAVQAPTPDERRVRLLLGLRAVDFVCDLGRSTLVEFLRVLAPDVHFVAHGTRLGDGRLADVSSLGVKVHVEELHQGPVASGRETTG